MTTYGGSEGPREKSALGSGTHGLGLRPHVNRFAHVTANVSDLERAREFWEAVFPVKAVARTGGTSHPFRSLGLDSGRFDGYMLQDSSSFPSRAIHLVEWKSPKPVGAPYAGRSHVGWYRICALSSEVERRFETVVAAGGRPYAKPRPGNRKSGQDPSRVTFAFADPDGITLEYVTANRLYGAGGEVRDSAYHVNANCRDLARSFAFYTRVTGLDLLFRTQPAEPRPAAQAPAYCLGWDGPVYYDALFLGHRADMRSPIDLVRWLSPEPTGSPYASPFNLGIMRLALEVDDIEAAYRALIAAPGIPAGSVAGPPEPWDFGELGTRRVVVFHDPDGLALEMIERPPYGWETDPARDSYSPLPGLER